MTEPRSASRAGLTREQAIWLIIRAIGLNVLVFGVIESMVAIQYGLRSLGYGSSAWTAASRDYAFWVLMRVGAHALLAAYLLRGGEWLYRLVDAVIPGAESETRHEDRVAPYGPPDVPQPQASEPGTSSGDIG